MYHLPGQWCSFRWFKTGGLAADQTPYETNYQEYLPFRHGNLHEFGTNHRHGCGWPGETGPRAIGHLLWFVYFLHCMTRKVKLFLLQVLSRRVLWESSGTALEFKSTHLLICMESKACGRLEWACLRNSTTPLFCRSCSKQGCCHWMETRCQKLKSLDSSLTVSLSTVEMLPTTKLCKLRLFLPDWLHQTQNSSFSKRSLHFFPSVSLILLYPIVNGNPQRTKISVSLLATKIKSCVQLALICFTLKLETI